MHKAIQFTILALMTAPLIMVAQTSNVTLPQDKGPGKIDVSSYPPEQQKAYKVFDSKCSKCHTIARPINTTMTKPEWERYVKRCLLYTSDAADDLLCVD